MYFCCRQKTSKITVNALEAIGNTPMIKLNKIPKNEGLKCDVCEYIFILPFWLFVEINFANNCEIFNLML